MAEVTSAPTSEGGAAAQARISTEDLEERVWDELGQCFDPEIPVNIVDLGLVYAVRAEPLSAGDHHVAVLMTVTSPGCGVSEILRHNAERLIASLPGVRDVEIAITFDPPWTPEMMSAEARLLLNLWSAEFSCSPKQQAKSRTETPCCPESCRRDSPTNPRKHGAWEKRA